MGGAFGRAARCSELVSLEDAFFAEALANATGVTTAAVSPDHGAALVGLFERLDWPCFCRYWHFTGDKNAWLARCFGAPDESRREMLEALERGADEMRGSVAVTPDGAVVGWMKMAPCAALDKLYAQRLYRGLPCFSGDRTGVWTVGCFIVDEPWRRRGIAHALLARGLVIALLAGANAVEAFPRRAEGVGSGELWTGPASVFVAAGFEEVHAFAPYPVLRLRLT
jgi:GNAT superfamily N-acetyltransferase